LEVLLLELIRLVCELGLVQGGAVVRVLADVAQEGLAERADVAAGR
jgi:hypothetical protein